MVTIGLLWGLTLMGILDRPGPAHAASDTAEMANGDMPGPVQRRLKQLTGAPHHTGAQPEPDFADPSFPDVLPDGRIRMTGTSSNAGAALRPHHHIALGMALPGSNAAIWSSWSSFLRGEEPRREVVRVHRSHQGRLIELNHDETLWDMTIQRWSGQEVLWGGALTPTSGEHAVMWEDNWTRRVWPFLRDASGNWVRSAEPLFGTAPATTPGYLGHTYGHQFIADGVGRVWVFYERVSEQTATGAPWRTALYARPMLSATRASEEEHLILDPGEPPRPSSVRAAGDALIEGARPVRVSIQGQSFYLLGFSAGEFRSARYGLHFAFSRHLLGPYQPYLTADGRDFLDLGSAIRARYDLSMGPGRPVLFQDPEHRSWLLFHASQASQAALRPGARQVYLAPVELSLDEVGDPVITLSDQNPGGAESVTTGVASGR